MITLFADNPTILSIELEVYNTLHSYHNSMAVIQFTHAGLSEISQVAERIREISGISDVEVSEDALAIRIKTRSPTNAIETMKEALGVLQYPNLLGEEEVRAAYQKLGLGAPDRGTGNLSQQERY